VNPDRNNFGPRVGVVYKLDDQTLRRGGWGPFYNLFDRVGSEDQLALSLIGNRASPQLTPEIPVPSQGSTLLVFALSDGQRR
jgi:hypothetical protein